MRKSIWQLCMFTLVIFISCSFPVFAQDENNTQTNDYYTQQYEASGAQQLPQSLPEETQKILQELGVADMDFYSILALSPSAVLDSLFSLLYGQMKQPVAATVKVIGILLLLAVAESFAPKESKLRQCVLFVGAALLVLCLLPALSATIRAAASAIDSSAQFMLLFIPIYAGVVTASGNPMLALNYHSLSLLAAQGLAQLSQGFVVPFTGMFLAAGVGGSLAPEYKLQSVAQTAQTAVIWIFSSTAALFAGLLSLKGILANAADSLTSQGVKLALKTAVPVVGGALSDAYSSIAGSVGLLKSALGIFGMLATVLLCLPVLLELLLWILGLKLSAITADMLEIEHGKQLLDTVAGALILLCGLVVFSAVLLLLATGITLAVRNGV